MMKLHFDELHLLGEFSILQMLTRTKTILLLTTFRPTIFLFLCIILYSEISVNVRILSIISSVEVFLNKLLLRFAFILRCYQPRTFCNQFRDYHLNDVSSRLLRRSFKKF